MALLPDGERGAHQGFSSTSSAAIRCCSTTACAIIDRATGLTSLGVVPWFDDARTCCRRRTRSALNGYRTRRRSGAIKIAVPRLPRIANFDDLDPLRAEPDVRVELVEPGQALPADADLILLPGSKSTIADLAGAARRRAGTSTSRRMRGAAGACSACAAATRCWARGSTIPTARKGRRARSTGSACSTSRRVLGGDKALLEVDRPRSRERRKPCAATRCTSAGPAAPDCARPMLDLGGRPDGAVSADGRIMGSYLHGLFAGDDFRHAFLERAARARRAATSRMRRWWTRCSTSSPITSARHLDTQRILDLASRTAR